jgi:hypothetical protein
VSRLEVDFLNLNRAKCCTKRGGKKMDADIRIFVAEMKKQLSLRGWNYSKLAAETGYSVSAIEKLAAGSRTSAPLINAVSRALGMR